MEKRTLYKVFGIRFDILVNGKVRAFLMVLPLAVFKGCPFLVTNIGSEIISICVPKPKPFIFFF